jgi:1-acyl-sn-glycerol-3-phosphate acyltransferase
MTNEDAHRRARERGVSGPLYAAVRAVAVPFMRTWFRLQVTDPDRIPESGAAIIAPNHKSFWDAFFIAACTRRHLRYMGKTELFEGPFGPLLVRLGAFPVRRGQSDADALETARVLLEQGELLAVFPEGTRIRDPDELGDPRRGAGRLALEARAPLVPAAITGSDHLFLGPIPKPKKVAIAFGERISVAELAPSQEAAGKLVEELLWPEVSSQFRRLRGRQAAGAAAGIAFLGAGGYALRRRRRR